MTKTSRLARSAAAAVAFFIAGSAFAQAQAPSRGTFTAEAGISYLSGKTLAYRDVDNTDRDSRGLNLAFGWEHPSGFGVRAVYIGDLQFRSVPFARTAQSFDYFAGVEATGSVPVASSVNLKGGLGIGRSRLDNGVYNNSGDVAHDTDGLLSAGLQWRPSTHFALELHVDHLTKSGVTATSLMAQVPF